VSHERPPPERDDKERERRRLERVLPEIIKRLIETGYEKISEGPENVRQFVSELKLPKEALALILAQLDDTKNGLYRVVAKEIRDFLEHSNLAEELSKALTTLSFEIKTEVRFIPNEAKVGAAPRPDVRSKVSIKRDRRERGSHPPPEPSPRNPSHPPPDASSVPPPPSSSPGAADSDMELQHQADQETEEP
jgi:hypothetical protein